jgi:hypothetical protein
VLNSNASASAAAGSFSLSLVIPNKNSYADLVNTLQLALIGAVAGGVGRAQASVEPDLSCPVGMFVRGITGLECNCIICPTPI